MIGRIRTLGLAFMVLYGALFVQRQLVLQLCGALPSTLCHGFNIVQLGTCLFEHRI